MTLAVSTKERRQQYPVTVMYANAFVPQARRLTERHLRIRVLIALSKIIIMAFIPRAVGVFQTVKCASEPARASSEIKKAAPSPGFR